MNSLSYVVVHPTFPRPGPVFLNRESADSNESAVGSG